ncbi:MAG: hypothetical protein H6Q32_542 [Bacteroidetes bacterium]|nr:hypothetical protein [Bacteroidota bacterium]
MQIERRISMMEQAFERQLKNSVAADTKVATYIGINTTMLAVLAALVTGPAGLSFWTILLAAVSAAGLLLGLLFLTLSSTPRTSRASKSIIFFGSIAKQSTEAYAEAVKTVTHEDYLDDLIRQTHRTAEIATEKYRWIQRSQIAWYASILPWLLTVYALYRE